MIRLVPVQFEKDADKGAHELEAGAPSPFVEVHETCTHVGARRNCVKEGRSMREGSSKDVEASGGIEAEESVSKQGARLRYVSEVEYLAATRTRRCVFVRDWAAGAGRFEPMRVLLLVSYFQTSLRSVVGRFAGACG